MSIHEAVGTRSEGPVYLLQTCHGDYGLIFTPRERWKPDYRLAYYNGQMVQATGTLVDFAESEAETNLSFLINVYRGMWEEQRIDGVLLVVEIDLLATALIPTDDFYGLCICNAGTTDITDLHVKMTGAVGSVEGVCIGELRTGEITERLDFQLPIQAPDETPADYGAFEGTYQQVAARKEFKICEPASAVILTIEEDGFTATI